MKEIKEYGHKKMVVWQNIDRLDLLAHNQIIPKIPYSKSWLRRQIESSLDSVGANFVEGYYSGSIPEYLRFLRYSRRSLAELRDHVSRMIRKGLLGQTTFALFEKLTCQTLYLFGRLIKSLEAKL
jgi:four helix bundle protein